MTAKRFTISSLILVLAASGYPVSAETVPDHPEFEAEVLEARQALKRAVRYYHSISIEGGYPYFYSLDLATRWGEGPPMGPRSIEVQPPGTPAVGHAMLRAWATVGDPAMLTAARDAARALVRGQNEHGGWGHKIHFDRPPSDEVSFDDNQTQSAIRFLMAIDQEVEDPGITNAVDRSLAMMVQVQMDHGGWPHKYPKQHNYHDFATYNDHGIADCLAVMIDAHRYYGKEAYKASIDRTGWFILLSQLPPPQPGWAQQYNDFLQPAWARAFEPPAVCPSVTVQNLQVLMDLHQLTGEESYLEPIPDALDWVDACRLPNGLWPRFVEIGTGKPLYYDRGRIRVDSMADLSLERRTGYGYETDLAEALEKARERMKHLRMGSESTEPAGTRSGQLLAQAIHAIETLDETGRWITRGDNYKVYRQGETWDGEYAVSDRLSSAVFIENVDLLCDFLDEANALSR